ncbi:STAS domain-containing protein [Streptomyces sp. NPDC048257]|uniref:STAS domain-containing protein n=1 Tax=Streptomyces sp. NPDC048257 TaxID=3365526 RepID=UPI003722E4D7
MISTDVRRCGSSVLVSRGGELDEQAGPVLRQALDDIVVDARDLMVDLHGARSMNSAGPLHLLDLHRHAECVGLRGMAIGRHPRPGLLHRRAVRAGGLPPPHRAPRTGRTGRRLR